MAIGNAMNQKGSWGMRLVGNGHWECNEPKRLLGDEIGRE
jgi:hypothetical protein